MDDVKAVHFDKIFLRQLRVGVEKLSDFAVALVPGVEIQDQEAAVGSREML